MFDIIALEGRLARLTLPSPRRKDLTKLERAIFKSERLKRLFLETIRLHIVLFPDLTASSRRRQLLRSCWFQGWFVPKTGGVFLRPKRPTVSDLDALERAIFHHQNWNYQIRFRDALRRCVADSPGEDPWSRRNTLLIRAWYSGWMVGETGYIITYFKQPTSVVLTV